MKTRTKQDRTRTAPRLAVCGLALMLTAGTAQAQNALGDGRSLDRSLQTGNRVNSRVRDIDAQIRFSNAIVTGNAPGGASFRGEVGYVAPGEFRADLGSNDIFPFQRDTAPPSIGAQAGVRGTQALRYQFGLTTGTAAPLEFRGPLAFERSGSGATGAEVSSGLRSTADFLTRQSLRPIVVGVGEIDRTRLAAVTASPLIGVRTLEVPSIDSSTEVFPTLPVTPEDVGGAESGREPLGVPTGTGIPDPTDPTGATQGDRPGEATERLTGLGLPRDEAARQRASSAYTGFEPFARGVQRPDQSGLRHNLAAPTTQLQPQSMAHREVVDRVRQELETGLTARVPGQVDQSRQVQTQQDPAAIPASDIERRLEDLRRRLAGEPPLEDPTQTRNTTEPQPAARPRPGELPDPLTPTTPEQREQRRRDAMRQAGIADPVRGGFDPETVEALRRSRITVHDLQSPTIADNLVYAENMAAGQNLLAQGRYFDAEERFVRAAAAIPGEAMASVGRIHSQVGAGLYMSAAVNLRSLLMMRPELVPVRYAENLLPSADRWGTIRQQLQARVAGEDPSAARSAALLLAYLGYQFRDEPAIREGLDALRNAPEMQVDSESAMVSLLSQVWLDQPAEK